MSSERDHSFSKAAVLNRGIDVLLVIRNTPVATSKEIRDQALPYLTLRSTQRYLKTLVQAGLIGAIGGGNDEYRYFLTPKTKQLFGVQG
ncbi:hypothetical protein [Acinetobacter sp. HR7]|uniref:hypothetical protein n=1 Tax=Acinetobacter sp. HR7 TaxID=1509403 RepID=UPI000557EEA0|nr:hypothetical protein [Acinetobacter sp. HR7]